MTNGAIDFVVTGFIPLCATRPTIAGGARLLLAVILICRAGEFQIMSAGTGIRHSEYNPSSTERLHLYQIWIMPEENGITPRYEQRRFDAVQGKQLVLSPDARDGSLKVHQDMELYRWALVKDEQSVHQIAAERRIWIQVVKGNVTINGVKASTSDGLAIWDEQAISIHADSDSEILLFDLPPV